MELAEYSRAEFLSETARVIAKINLYLNFFVLYLSGGLEGIYFLSYTLQHLKRK